MMIPAILYDQMIRAWAGPPPAFPQTWATPYKSEFYDLYRVFAGKLWHEVDCSKLPRYFEPLTWLLIEPTRSVGASAYYLATYMRCTFSIDESKLERPILNIELFLSRAIKDPPAFWMTAERCRAVALFLEITRKVFEYYDVSIADQWKALADDLEIVRQGEL